MFLFHMETNAFFKYLENYIYLHLMESICFYFMWKQTHFPSRDFIQQEVLNSRKTGCFSQNRKSMMSWDFLEEMSHQISIVFWVIRLSCDIR